MGFCCTCNISIINLNIFFFFIFYIPKYSLNRLLVAGCCKMQWLFYVLQLFCSMTFQGCFSPPNIVYVMFSHSFLFIWCHHSVTAEERKSCGFVGGGWVGGGGFGAFSHLAEAFCSIHCKFLTCLQLEHNNFKYSTGACFVLFLVKYVWVIGLVLASHIHTQEGKKTLQNLIHKAGELKPKLDKRTMSLWHSCKTNLHSEVKVILPNH